jgi:Bacterial SH3 domain
MKLQNLEAIIVVFVLIFVLMVMIPRCRKNPATEAPVVAAPIPTPQALPPAGGEPAPTTPAVAEANPAATTPAVAPAAVVPAAPAAPVEKVTTPESFARKLTPKPMTTTTQRAVPSATVPAAGKEETVAFNPNGGTAEASGSMTFYTVVPDVKIRAQPGLDAKVLGKIPKDIAVTYLNVRTDKTQKVTIDNIPHDEPWLKIRTKKGTVGWVYGGTVRGYKK